MVKLFMNLKRPSFAHTRNIRDSGYCRNKNVIVVDLRRQLLVGASSVRRYRHGTSINEKMDGSIPLINKAAAIGC